MLHVIEAAEKAAFREYTDALAALARPPGTQFDLEDAIAAAARISFWRETWRCCLIEGARRELAAALS